MNRRQMLMVVAGAALLRGQEFEAASIKPAAPMGMGMMRVGISMLPGGRVSMSGVTLRLLIEQAYGVKDYQIVGGPSWLGSERYDITAKPEESATQDQVKIMIQALLKDRFKLQFHRETKELPTYALVVAKGGPKMHVSEVVAGSDGQKGQRVNMMGRGNITAEGASMSVLANLLGQRLGKPVFDKTELTANYDLKLDWSPEEGPQGMMKGPAGDGPSASDNTGASIFTALQEQLGLKLESTKGPVEIMVIERAEKASEN
jgi:uncharacterized protein (TIGR03435 family)